MVVVTTRVNAVAVADVSSLFAYYMRSVINFTHLTRAQLQYLHSSRTLARGVQTASKKIGKSKRSCFCLKEVWISAVVIPLELEIIVRDVTVN